MSGDSSRGRVRFFTDYACPFSYLAEHVVERLGDSGPAVERVGLQLRPEPTPLPAPDAPELDRQWEEAILPLARRMRVDARRPGVVPRTAKAHEAAAFARRHGAFDRLHRAIFRAYFVEGRDIGRIDELVHLAGAVGLDETELRIALDIDAFADAVAEAEQEAARSGVTGVPAFATNEETVLGLQPPGVLIALAAGGAERRRT